MRWTEPEWLDEARAWIEAQVAVAGEIEQPHVRPWSTVLRVPTADGDLWFKAVTALHRFEPALTALLGRLLPDRVPELVALDEKRAWMLMRDGGTRLRELPATVEHWEAALPRYAELQIAAAPQANELLDLGVPDFRLDKLPRLVEEMLAEQPLGLSVEEHQAMLDRVPELAAMARELAAYGVAETVQHDDLHDGQVFVRDGRYVVFDWGDACVSHPFHTLTVTLRAAAWRLELEPGEREVLRMRDAYLEPFGRPAELASAADIAYRTGTLARAYAWHRYVAAAQSQDEEDAEAVAYGVKRFLENGPIGAWRE
ncbi:MAG TPA: phosphotransferase [Gaiellaceae bacterium]|nr:phosphotransferase [Gaiellaceae bacterium]